MHGNTSNTDRLPTVVLVDDDEESLRLIQNRLAKARVKNPVVVFRSGVEFLGRLADDEDTGADFLDHSCLMLLDLLMPGVNGLDVLGWLHARPLLNKPVIVMLSYCDDPEAISRARELGAHTYLLKYPSAETLAALVHYAEMDAPLHHRP